MDVGAKKGPRSDINIHAAGGRGAGAPHHLMVLTPLMEKEIGVRVPEDVPRRSERPPPPT